MTDRKRDPLPEGYRFGDAGCNSEAARDERAFYEAYKTSQIHLRDVMSNLEIISLGLLTHWNVIEHEEH